MSSGTAMSMTGATAWVYLRSGNCTIRWRRGDKVAYVFAGKQLETYPDEAPRAELLDTIPLSSKGWADLTHVRLLGENWVKTRHQRN